MKVANFTGLIFACLFTLVTSVGVAGDDIELNIESGKALIQTGKFQMSAELLNKLLTQRKDEMKDHPRHAEAWYLFSVSLRKLGRIDLADKALERAKKLRELAQGAKSPADNETKASETDFSATEEEQVTASATGNAALADAAPAKQPDEKQPEPPPASPEPAVENEKNIYLDCTT